MDDVPTCGKGLAEHAPLPAKLAALSDAVAEVLEIHMRALDTGDEAARKELDAYSELARSHRGVAVDLASLAARMAAYRDLPMGRHDEQVMMSAEARNAFERFVRGEQDLLALLQHRLAQDQEMLDAMRGTEATRA
jgi:hypothetical protein